MTPMTPFACREAVRSAGLCGHLLEGATKICICLRGHDDGVHDRGWQVTRRVEEAPYERDARESTTVYRVSDAASERVFETENGKDAEWLASTLTRLEL